MNKITQTTKLTLISLVIFSGFSYAYAWTPPIVVPPGGNTEAPLNTSGNIQNKANSINLTAGCFSINGKCINEFFDKYGNAVLIQEESPVGVFKELHKLPKVVSSYTSSPPTGYDNTAIGGYALISNTKGAENTAIGSGALKKNTLGDENTAIGSHTLQTNDTGNRNTAVGFQALKFNTEGEDNSAYGRQALGENKKGKKNTAIGKDALALNKKGNENTAVGVGALGGGTEGNFNTAVGVQALEKNEKGNYNTAIGRYALDGNKEGSLNTAIGYLSDVGGDDLKNATAIGFGAIVYNDNEVQIGNSSVEAVRTKGDVFSKGFKLASDSRLKENIKNVSDEVLSKVLQLQGVQFSWKSNGQKSIGLIAQDVEKLFPELVSTDKTTGLKSLEYTGLISPLIEVAKRQQAQIEKQQTEIDELKEAVRQLRLVK